MSPAALLAAGRYFPLLAPIPPEVVSRPPSEGDRPVGTVAVYMCNPCGIRYVFFKTKGYFGHVYNSLPDKKDIKISILYFIL